MEVVSGHQREEPCRVHLHAQFWCLTLWQVPIDRSSNVPGTPLLMLSIS
jgi:hypothetical protein